MMNFMLRIHYRWMRKLIWAPSAWENNFQLILFWWWFQLKGFMQFMYSISCISSAPVRMIQFDIWIKLQYIFKKRRWTTVGKENWNYYLFKLYWWMQWWWYYNNNKKFRRLFWNASGYFDCTANKRKMVFILMKQMNQRHPKKYLQEYHLILKFFMKVQILNFLSLKKDFIETKIGRDNVQCSRRLSIRSRPAANLTHQENQFQLMIQSAFNFWILTRQWNELR